MNKNLKITYLKKAAKFLGKNSHILTESDVDELIIKSVKKKFYFMDINIDLKELKGSFQNKYRIRKGNIRIIVEMINEEIIIEAIINDIDFRGDVYK